MLAFLCKTCDFWYTIPPYRVVDNMSFCCFECLADHIGVTTGHGSQGKRADIEDYRQKKGGEGE